ncbi:hypothetical protein [Flexibacterium corallicola]|nr:hypothetical protein [Pseudovibrio sp. M1P-2-3]
MTAKTTQAKPTDTKDRKQSMTEEQIKASGLSGSVYGYKASK